MRRRWFFSLFLLLAISSPASALAPEREGTRVEVIAPSTPVLDDFTMTYILARRGPAPDPAYRGEVWMWTDAPWIRPYHIIFTAADRGLIHYRMKFSGPARQRIESYELGPASAISVWSNPIQPVAPGAPRLLWGALDRCDQPGLDFCLSESGLPPALPGAAAVGLVAVRVGEKIYVLDPDGPDADDFLAAARSGSVKKLDDLVEDGRATVAPAGPPADLLEKIGPPAAGPLLGAWVADPSPAGIYAALRRGSFYFAFGGRILLKPLDNQRLLVAGYGPRLEVIVGGASAQTFATDDDHLILPRPAGSFSLVAQEQGRAAIATNRTFIPF